MAGRLSMGARREVLAAVAGRYRSARRADKGRILDELCATTGWHRKHAVRALRRHGTAEPIGAEARPSRKRKYGATVEDAVTALWEASDRVCGKRLVVMIPTLLPVLERHGRLRLGAIERTLVLSVSAATIDRLLGDVKVAAASGRPDTFGDKQHSIVQRLLKALRRKAAQRVIAETTAEGGQAKMPKAGVGGPAVGLRPPSGPTTPAPLQPHHQRSLPAASGNIPP